MGGCGTGESSAVHKDCTSYAVHVMITSDFRAQQSEGNTEITFSSQWSTSLTWRPVRCNWTKTTDTCHHDHNDSMQAVTT